MKTNALLLLALGTALATTTLGCGDDTGGGGGSGAAGGEGTGATGTGATGTGATGTGATGTGATGTGGSGAGATGGSGGSGGGAGGGGGIGTGGTGGQKYAFCGECSTGAPNDECNAERLACEADTDCNTIKNCSFNGCTSDEAGACCTMDCEAATNNAGATTLFRAFDQCVYCETCIDVCSNAPAYCAVFPNDPNNVCL